MQRGPNGEINFERLDIFEIISHQISTQNNIDTRWDCVYEHVKLFTDANNPIIALRYCRYGKLNCYDLNQETPTTKAILKDDHFHVQEQNAIINQQFNAYQNCFGFCVLDGQFWINLTPENLNQILNEDDYIDPVNINLDHLVVYYQNDVPVHIAKYNAATNEFQHKIGCNTHGITPTIDIPVYTYNDTRRFVRNI